MKRAVRHVTRSGYWGYKKSHQTILTRVKSRALPLWILRRSLTPLIVAIPSLPMHCGTSVLRRGLKERKGATVGGIIFARRNGDPEGAVPKSQPDCALPRWQQA